MNAEEVPKTKCYYCDEMKECRNRPVGFITICDECDNESVKSDSFSVAIEPLEEEEEVLETKCGCIIVLNTKEHDECRCDDDGENWICGDCYDGEYDEDEDKEDEEEKKS